MKLLMRLWAVAAVAVTLALQLALAPTASAHTELVETTPSIDATVDSGTASVLLAFSDRVVPDVVRGSVTDARGHDHVVADPIVDGGRVLLPLEPLTVAGHYTVRYRVVAVDGHEVAGSFGFDLSAAGAGAAGEARSPTPGDDPFDAAHAVGPRYDDPAGLPVPTWLVVAGGAVGLAALLRLAAARRDEPEPLEGDDRRSRRGPRAEAVRR